MHDVYTHRFDNGLTLHVAPGHPAPVAAVQAWVGVGSADETPAQAGLAHLIEHMLFKGSSEYALGELTRAIELGGGEINAWTAFDHTVYHAVLGRDHVDAAIDAIGDALQAPRIEPDELAREREVIVEEIRQGSDDPARGVAQSLFATAFAAHPYRRPVIGTVDNVRRLGERELVEFFRAYYVADNLTLVVAGDVDPRRIVRCVERRFRAMPSGRPTRCWTTEPAQSSPRVSCTSRDLSEAYVAIGAHIPPARHRDLAALDVAAILLGQSESARLVRMLRDRDRLVTSAYANVHALLDPGLFVLSATMRAADVVRAIAALLERTRELADQIDSDELDKARIAAEAGFIRQLETAQGRARSLGWYATMTGDPQFGHVYLDRIRAVRRHDIQSVIARYLRPETTSVAAITPIAGTRRSHAKLPSSAERVLRTTLASSPQRASVVDHRVVLPNGMVVIVRRDPSVPVVAMRAVWKGGQRTEHAKHAGASTLLARMITRGCGDRNARAITDLVDRLGGALGGVAGRNSFGIASEWSSRTWRPGLELLADCIMAPTLPVGELARERRLLLDDQRAVSDSPTQIAFRAFSETLYGDHPYARDALGTSDSVGDLSRPKLLARYRACYPVSALTLAVVGDVEIDEVVAAVRARFGKAPRKAAARTTMPRSMLAFDGRSATDREVHRYLDRAQAQLVIGFPGATVDAPDRFALEVLIQILGGQSGRLFAELRERQALVYRVSAHSVEGIDPGFVAIYLSCAPEKLGAAIAAVHGELASVRATVSDDEVVRAQSYLIGSHHIAMQRRSAIANAIAYHEAYGLGWQTWAGYGDAIRAVSADAVVAAAASYLRPERAITAMVQPSEPRTPPKPAKRSDR
ncbi:MAG: M16 family metallopeptidase [Kofleriaceae bacterium]